MLAGNYANSFQLRDVSPILLARHCMLAIRWRPSDRISARFTGSGVHDASSRESLRVFIGSRLLYLENLEYLLFGLSILQRQILILFRDILALLSGTKEVGVILLARIFFKLVDDKFEICLFQYWALAWEVGFDHLKYGLAKMLLIYVHKVNFKRGTILTEDVQLDLPLLTLMLLTLFRQRCLGSSIIFDVNFLTDLP